MANSTVVEPLPAQPAVQPRTSETNALFDSIAQDPDGPVAESQSSSLKAFFAGLLWFGYAVAIVVALVLVWSAANGLLLSLPR